MSDHNVVWRAAGNGGGGDTEPLGSNPRAVIQRHFEVGLDIARLSQTQELAGREPRCSAAGEVKPGWAAATGEPAFELRALHTGDAWERAAPRGWDQRGGVRRRKVHACRPYAPSPARG